MSYMNNSYINQITLEYLINKEIIDKHAIAQREKKSNKEDLQFYKKRIVNLFNEIISNKQPTDLYPDVEYAYEKFIKSSINYFKVKDNNDLLQEEYTDNLINDMSCNKIITNEEQTNDADKLLMRSVKVELHTLDKYVKKNSMKIQDNIIIQKEKNNYN